MSIKEEPFISVVTPVYNGGKFLRECIESVLNQDYDNWEYILLNNYSTDDSLQIMQEYAEKDERIRIYDNEEFLPQMKNLNHAFRQISPDSKYCKMICADDWIFPDCLSKMVEIGEEYPSVGIVSAYRLVNNKVHLDGLPYPSNFNSGKDIARRYLLNGSSVFGSPTSLLFRSDLILKRDKVFEESHQASDTGACIDILKESDLGFVHQVLTFSRRHEDTISNTEAKESFAFIHAKLYNQLTYGPFFLTEKELKKSYMQRINLYYILLARNFFDSKSMEDFKRQLEVLDELGLEFETGRFLKKFTRELFLQVLKKFGIELRRSS
ncbi:glycosyltransferase family 2 protein [Fodinibius sp. SL11]|uniref:glycosyltransferase family 2 protein n=1 Tax=Fodinibius sp. SL11 TaxID=3425690 RepID=UPI003F88115C